MILAKEETPPSQMKPDPFVYEQVVSRLGHPAQRVAAIEDSPRGIQAAIAAGLVVIGVATTHAEADLQAADEVVHSMVEASKLIA